MLLFLCLFVFPLTSANQKTRNSMFGHSLLASPYNETDVGELWECYKLCYDDKENCASINYDMKKGRCKRMKVTHVNLPCELVKMKDHVYADIRGCAKKQHPLGMEDGSIPDSSITASSQNHANYSPYYGRLNNQAVSGKRWGSWAAKINQKGEYLQVDLGRVTWVTHVATQGRPKGSSYIQWVTEYTVEYSLTGDQWQSYPDGNGVIKIFPGNSDQTTVVKNEFSPAIKARYVRIVVQAWYSYITMRAEFYGCAA
ncbi:lactadherin-like [Nematostella vectensis]|uniref:lactadherin-like n=1 Tax=Nematostella vectensis TaxID=45351 RepID=UPI00207742FB|nr:lactadherin-like [Nematostella vectensis]